MVQHPVTEEAASAGVQIRATLKALQKFNMPKIIISP
jgi:hypothetical protein